MGGLGGFITIIEGDCIESMRAMKDRGERVQLCVTSPPYFGLRDYGADGQIGLEQTPAEYVAKMVSVFSAVRDVLDDDGTLWLNLGDSYAGSGKGAWNASDERKSSVKETYRPAFRPGSGRADGEVDARGQRNRNGLGPVSGIAAKNLMLIPSRVAMALQDDGWILRAACPWLKRNGMPDSTRDRPTQTIEWMFLFAKSPNYFYDGDAVKIAAKTGANGSRLDTGKTGAHQLGRSSNEPRVESTTRLRRSSDSFFESWQGMLQSDDGDPLAFVVNTKPYREAHFATFPPKLIEPCVLSGSRAGDTILDPFAGSGTTGEVAKNLGRNAVLLELNHEYAELARKRCGVASPTVGELDFP